jgi:hypothetical protein
VDVAGSAAALGELQRDGPALQHLVVGWQLLERLAVAAGEPNPEHQQRREVRIGQEQLLGEPEHPDVVEHHRIGHADDGDLAGPSHRLQQHRRGPVSGSQRLRVGIGADQ